MRYRMDGEDYFTTAELLAGPVRKLHPTASRCFIDNGRLVVIDQHGEHRYSLVRESASLTLVTTP
jgi:hypothetical protein